MPDVSPTTIKRALFGCLVVIAIRYAFVLSGIGLIGWDSYPLIEINRVGGAGDLIGLFTRPLMGDYGSGLYYRPVLSATFALDHSLWGLWVPGYHLTTLVIFVATLLSVHRLLLRAAPSAGGAFAAAVGVIFIALHPVHGEILPVAARRADLLAVLWMSTALTDQLADPSRGRSRPLRAALWTALALLSKESALLLPGLLWIAAFVTAPATSAAFAASPAAKTPAAHLRDVFSRALHALRAIVPSLAAAFAVLGIRLLLLGGIVGNRPMLESGLATASVTMLARILRASLDWEFRAGGVGTGSIAAVAFVIAYGAHSLLSRHADGGSDRWSAVGFIAPLLGLGWLIEAAVLFAKGLILPRWYIINPVVALSLLLAAGMASSGPAPADAAGRTARRGITAAALVLLVVTAAKSPVIRGLDSWHTAARIQTDYLDLLAGKIEQAPKGSRIEMPRVPAMLPRKEGGSPIGGLAIMAGYSVKAWASLRYPDRRIRVEVGRAIKTPPGPDEVVVQLGALRS